MVGWARKVTARIRASSLDDKPIGNDHENRPEGRGEEEGPSGPAFAVAASAVLDCGRRRFIRGAGSPWVASACVSMNGVSPVSVTDSITFEYDAEDMWVLYLRRYHKKVTIPAASNTRAATPPMMALTILLTPCRACDGFDDVVVVVLVVLNLIVCTGVLHKEVVSHRKRDGV
jgi:hypothetical protein